ncbi:MAG: efflux RND transporter periplasmic adaptor subunit [Alphaproteobacteria bacterium]|nr:efflux RND transporter periplasmic adaptor subunit [Alphaproteobacteria bacterium]
MINRFAAILLALVPLGLAAACEEAPPEKEAIRPVRAMKVGDADAFMRRTFPGRARAHEEIDLSFRVAGPLVARPVNVGDEVQAGAIVARIDPTDFEVALRQTQGQLRQAEAELLRAQADYERAQQILRSDPGAISQTTVDERLRDRDAAQANVDTLEANVDDAANRLDYTTLRAPFDATVVSTYVENYEFVQIRQRIARLLDKTKIEMVVDIPENLISLSPYVEDIKVRFDAFPDRPIPAKIFEIGQEANESTRTFPVTLLMDQPKDIQILPGMAGRSSARARPPEGSDEVGVVIPVGAVIADLALDKSFVWVIDEASKTVKKREVKTGAVTALGIKITEGLETGEWIATAGVNTLREGQEVRIQDEASAGAGE